ncbi:tape measure protein [Acidovorax sp. NB1]|uniref:tape measure protein n=1 Tax=Acidovorax sp. NB1 TaxID=1943571 RepID=UPI0010DEE084|nr:tape measure protein [Acidovorax sp. NB1]GDY37680.1 hypothetical protein ACINB_35720 [Acidovorax sp. NB1]
MSTEDIAAIGIALETDGVEKGIRALDTLASKGPAVEKAMGQVEGAAKKTGKTLENLGSSTAKGGIEGFGKAGSSAADGIDRLGKAADRSQKDVSSLNAALRSSSGDARSAARGYAEMAQSLESATRLAAGLFAGASFLGGVGKLVAVQREFDVLNSSLITVSGSAEIAAREFEWIEKFAKETPFGLAQATQGFVKMKALGLDPTRASLTSFGNTASAMGKDLNQMIEAVADASTGEFERLKEFGIKAKKEGDSVSLTFQGVTTTIGNSAQQITKYLEDIGNNQFGGAMAQRAKTLDGAIAELGDTWDGLFRTINERNAGTLIYDSVKLANGAIEDATTIIKALTGAYDEGERASGAFGSAQNGLATVFETVAVLGANVNYVLTQTGVTLGGFAAKVAAIARGDLAGNRAIGIQMKEDWEAARAAIDATERRIMGARKAQEEFNRSAAASTAGDFSRMDRGGSKPSAGSEVTGKPKKADLSEYDKLIQKLGQEIPRAAAEAEAAQMGYNKAQTEFLALAGSPLWASFTGQQRATVAALFERKIASEQAGDAEKALAKANIEAAQTREKYLASLQSGIEKIRADITAQEDATARMGLSKQAVADLDAAKLEMLATDTELQAIKALDRNLDQQTYDSLKEQAKLYRDLAAAKRVGAAKETALEIEKTNEEAARKAAEDWQRTADDINRSLTDALLRGFESGKDFAQNLRDTIKNMFSTLVLRPIVSAVVSPVAGALTGALGLAAPAAAAASGAGALSSAGGILSGVGALAGNFGAGISTGFSQLMGGNILGGLELGGGLIGSGATAGGLGTIAGVLGPIALGIGALTAIIGKTKGETRTGGQFGVAFDGSVTNQRRGQTYTIEGQQFDRDFTNGLQTALKDGIAYRLEGDPVAQESAIREAVAGTASGINGFLKALGSAATLTGFSAGLETSGKGRGGVFAGGLLSTGQGFGESGKGDNYAGTLFESFSTNSPDFKTALENFTLDLKQSTIQALQTVSDIPETVKKLLAQVDAEGLTEDAANKLLETINAQIVGVNQFKDALKGMGLDTLAALSFDAAAGLAEVSGGFDKLLGNLQTYYTNFFSGEEQRANLQRSLAQQLSGLGLQLPDINASNARDQFRALVSAAEKDKSEAGRKTYATLLALSGAFASITDAADGAAEAVKKQQDAVYSQFQRALGRDRDGLNSQASALQDTISGIADAVDTLRSNARDLYQTVDGTRNMLAAQGMVYIEQALAGVRAGGSVADYSGLSDAISAARSGIDGGRYATQFERERDALVLAGQLSQLADSGELQLSFEERQLRAVNEQLEYLNTLDKRAEELVNGTTTLTGTVQSYFDQLLAILKPADPEQGQGAQPGGAFAGVGGGGGGVMGTPVDQDALLKARIDQQLRFGEEKGLAFNDPAVLASINAALYGSGATNADIARLYDIPKEDVDRLFAGAGIPRFDIGTNYVPRDMLAYIHEGEAVVPKAYNPAANPGAGGGSNADLAEAVNRLAEQNAILAARLEAIENNTKLMPQMGRQFNDVTNGGTVLRSKAVA